MKDHLTGDRELLEAAAIAAGMTGWQYARRNDAEWGMVRDNPNGSVALWNPLTDDGDALRLAVKLKLKVYQGEFVAIASKRMSHAYIGEEYEHNGMDAATATRRAIVRAAAALGTVPLATTSPNEPEPGEK